MTLLLSSYGVIMDRVINSLGHGKNVINILNAADKHYPKGEMELIGEL